MLQTVLRDKVKIEETIEELDRYKRDALMKTWQKVNRWRSSGYSLIEEVDVRHPVTLAISLLNSFLATLRSSSLLKDKISRRVWR